MYNICVLWWLTTRQCYPYSSEWLNSNAAIVMNQSLWMWANVSHQSILMDYITVKKHHNTVIFHCVSFYAYRFWRCMTRSWYRVMRERWNLSNFMVMDWGCYGRFAFGAWVRLITWLWCLQIYYMFQSRSRYIIIVRLVITSFTK